MSRPASSPLGDASMRAALVSVSVCGIAFTVTALHLGFRAALGVAVGGLMAALNLFVLAWTGEALLAGKARALPWGAVAALKMLLLFGGVSLILRSGLVPWVGFAIGYASLVAGIALAALFSPGPPG